VCRAQSAELERVQRGERRRSVVAGAGPAVGVGVHNALACPTQRPISLSVQSGRRRQGRLEWALCIILRLRHVLPETPVGLHAGLAY